MSIARIKAAVFRRREVKRTRWFIGLVTLAFTSVAVVAYGYALTANGINGFEAASIPCFAILFAWIAFSFSASMIGAARLLRRSDNPLVCSTEQSLVQPQQATKDLPQTAVLVPIYNESPADVFARIEAMARSLATHCEGSSDKTPSFDFYVLSDTTDTEVWLAEERAWAILNDRLEESVKSHYRVYYRHRAENTGRKAGNIADFCKRWSSPYQSMIVLDADSLMSAKTMLEMVRRMANDDRLGILQVPPVPIGRSSLFARLQQFSAQAYGPIFVEGFAAWAGEQGNYWGHNAIIRVAAFCECCDLPVLPGQAPLGGEILSHDFVEASLMVRQGWKVEIATDLQGSYEECPTTLSDYAMRDQRWCQGNLQHSRLVLSDGFHPVSRLHFASGVMAYVSSPLWIVFMSLCVLGWAWESPSPNATGWLERFGPFPCSPWRWRCCCFRSSWPS